MHAVSIMWCCASKAWNSSTSSKVYVTLFVSVVQSVSTSLVGVMVTKFDVSGAGRRPSGSNGSITREDSFHGIYWLQPAIQLQGSQRLSKSLTAFPDDRWLLCSDKLVIRRRFSSLSPSPSTNHSFAYPSLCLPTSGSVDGSFDASD